LVTQPKNRNLKAKTMNIKKYLGPLSKDNPILVQVLGVCSALAVTAQLKPAVVMGISVTAVAALGNLIISLLRNTIPPRIRIIVQLIIVAALVILVDQILQAYFYDISKMLSVFVGLIITNCILMGRIEAFALGNKPIPSFFDGLFNGLGYGLVLAIVGFVRELLANGSIWNHKIIPDNFYAHGYINNGLMSLPPMALILIGVLVWIQRSGNKTEKI
jgi:Na+-transporting NADH:ubiquinone oxidoreductase subunit D